MLPPSGPRTWLPLTLLALAHLLVLARMASDRSTNVVGAAFSLRQSGVTHGTLRPIRAPQRTSPATVPVSARG